MSNGIVSSFAQREKSAWSNRDAYESLLDTDYAGCAQEWLSRNAAFQRILKTLPCRVRKDISVVRGGIRYTRCAEQCPLSAFGVGCCLIDRDAPTILWLPESNSHALSVKATYAPKRTGGHDLRDCSRLKGVLQKDDERVHLLFREGRRTFQLAVHGVSRIDRPVSFQHSLQDLNRIRDNLDGFETLYALYQENRLPRTGLPGKKFVKDQIRGMQALDGKKAGATHREIANVIFRGDRALAGQWEDCYRSRTQRVLRKASGMVDGLGYLSLLKKGKILERGSVRKAFSRKEEESGRFFVKA